MSDLSEKADNALAVVGEVLANAAMATALFAGRAFVPLATFGVVLFLCRNMTPAAREHAILVACAGLIVVLWVVVVTRSRR